MAEPESYPLVKFFASTGLTLIGSGAYLAKIGSGRDVFCPLTPSSGRLMNRRNKPLVVPLAGALILTACVGGAPDRDIDLPNTDASSQELASTLMVRVGGDTVRLVLSVLNTTADTVVLEFATGQRADFLIENPAGTEVWRWSEDRGFTQMLGTERLPPGETLRYEAAWEPAGRSGRFEVVAWLTSPDRDVRRRVSFELPPT